MLSCVCRRSIYCVSIFYTCIEILKRNLCSLGRSIVIHNYKNKHPIYYQTQCLGFVRLLPWFTALFYRARVLTSNGFVLFPLWKKGKPKPFAATCACLPVQVQSQACFLPICHSRKATSWTRTACPPCFWQLKRVMYGHIREGKVTLAPALYKTRGRQGRPRPSWHRAVERCKVLIRRQPISSFPVK